LNNSLTHSKGSLKGTLGERKPSGLLLIQIAPWYDL